MLRLLARRIVAPTAAVAAAATSSRATAEAKPGDEAPLRVLITGFHDWRELDGNVWRCRDNPACRLLLGSPSSEPPPTRSGPLARALRAANADVDFTFQTLPVTWNTAAGLDLMRFDVVIHLGLGVYDRHDTILLEHGAFNRRSAAPDAIARNGSGRAIVEADGASTTDLYVGVMQPRYATLDTQPALLSGGGSDPAFQLTTAEAREANTYICNETRAAAIATPTRLLASSCTER